MRSHKITLYNQIAPDLYPEFVVVSEHMHSVIRTVQQIARFDANVLISGESGTGKELVARIIHQQSNRRDKPFVPVNCGTLSGALFESKLFGHERGAFTGAIRQTKGRFEQANKGTLFLDEVSEISPLNQVNFLRVLEDGRFCRIGGEVPIGVNVRILASTNRDLVTDVKTGRFRKDLYYRLKVIPINLLPLRKRKEAIPYLVNNFLERFAKLYQKSKVSLSSEAMEYLVSYDWPGNVRHLKNAVETMFLMAQGPCITASDLPKDLVDVAALDPGENPGEEFLDPQSTFRDLQVSDSIEPLRKTRQRVERFVILRALEITSGQRARAAELLEIKPRTLRQKMSDYGIKFRRTQERSLAKF